MTRLVAATDCRHLVEAKPGKVPRLCPACGGTAEVKRRSRRARYARRPDAERAYAANRRARMAPTERVWACGCAVPVTRGGHPEAPCPRHRAQAARRRAETRTRQAPSLATDDWAWQPPGRPTVTARPTPSRCRARADLACE